MDEEQAKNFKGLIWCPDSNFFLLKATADIKRLKTKTRILFGTDSTLTAGWNLWNHLRLARETQMMNDRELFETLTKTPSVAWGQNESGAISINKNADIVIAKSIGAKGFDAFYSLNPENIQLVLHEGKIRLFDEEIKDQLHVYHFPASQYGKVCLNGKVKFVYGNLPELANEILLYNPEIHFPFTVG